MPPSRHLLLGAAIAAIKCLDLPALFYNPCDPEADYKYYRPLYTAIPRRLFYALCVAADLATSYRINSFDYLYYSIFTPLDVSSLENFLLSCVPSSLDPILQFLDPAYFPITMYPYFATEERRLPAVGRECSHLPSLSCRWYHDMCMFEQFSGYSRSLMAVSAFCLASRDARLVSLFKTRATFKNYLLFVHRSRYISLYFAIYVVSVYLGHLFTRLGVANTNFLYWNSLLFTSLYVYDLKTRGLGAGGRCGGALDQF